MASSSFIAKAIIQVLSSQKNCSLGLCDSQATLDILNTISNLQAVSLNVGVTLSLFYMVQLIAEIKILKKLKQIKSLSSHDINDSCDPYSTDEFLKEFMKEIFNYDILDNGQSTHFLQDFLSVENLSSIEEIITKIKEYYTVDITPVKNKNLNDIISYNIQKLGSWFLLMIISFAMVVWVYLPKKTAQ